MLIRMLICMLLLQPIEVLIKICYSIGWYICITGCYCLYIFLLNFYSIGACNYRLTHSATELSGFTCTSSLTMNEKFEIKIWNFLFIVDEQVQVNPDISRAMSALTFLLFKLNTLQTKIVKLSVCRSHGVMTVVYWIYTTAIAPR